MDVEETLVRAGALLGDRRRIRMLMALVDGQAWPAGDLARYAGIQPATASHHLEQLVAGGLLTVIPQGRHRYYRLASPTVAELLEKLAALTPPGPTRSLSGSQQREALREGRTCYDHLAGQLGVAWAIAWEAQGWVERVADGYRLTLAGSEQLSNLQIPAPPDTLIPIHPVDWTERQPHLAGPLAKVMTQRLLELEWIQRGPIRRSIRVTQAGSIKVREMGVSLSGAAD